MLIGRQLMEVPLIHDKVSKEEARKRALDIVKAVRLPDPDRIMRAYPHQLSGGQQQRVVIAMALLSNPRLLILDEPTTALDVTVEAGIVALVKDLTARSGTSSLFISHNLGLILEHLRFRHSDVLRRGGRDGTGQGCVQRRPAPLYPGALSLDAAAGHEQERQSARPHSRPVAAAVRAAAGVQLLARAAAISSQASAIRPTCRCARSREGRPI